MPGGGGEGGDGQRDQVVVPEQQEALPGQRVRGVQAQHPADLGVHGAVGLVQLGPGRRGAGRDPLQLGGQAVQRGLGNHAAARAVRAGHVQDGLIGGQLGPARRRQVNRAGAVDDAVTAQLVAGGGDDGHRQLGPAADLLDGGGLGGGHGGQDVPDARLALGQPDGRRDLRDDGIDVHQPGLPRRASLAGAELAIRYPPTSCRASTRAAATPS
jgi:hypothetical protein